MPKLSFLLFFLAPGWQIHDFKNVDFPIFSPYLFRYSADLTGSCILMKQPTHVQSQSADLTTVNRQVGRDLQVI